MPGSTFKSRKTPEKAKVVSSVAEKKIFAKEMHFQVYRIENVLKITNADVLRGFAKTNPALLKQPALMRFFDAYQGKKTNEFIERAKTRSVLEREKLLNGIRKVIFKAKRTKQEYVKARTKVEKKAKTEQEKEISKMHEMLRRDLNKEDLLNIETNLATPIAIDKKRLNLKKIQYHYTSIITGQKAMGHHMQGMQKEYGDVVKKYQSHTNQYSSYKSWKKYLGLADYGWRKVKSVGGWLKKGWNWTRGKKTTAVKSESDRLNDAIGKVRDSFKGKIDRVKILKKRIAARAAELKKGLSVHKAGIREKLQTLISREDWTKAKKLKHEQIKALLLKQKNGLSQKLTNARIKGKEIDNARRGTFNLSANLKNKYKSINTGEGSLKTRIASVKRRIAQLEKMYGNKDPRVVHIRTKVLVPLLKGQDRMAQVKEGTAAKLNTVEEKNQRLDILKADMYVSKTSLADQISKTELQMQSESKKIDVLTKNRLELHKLLEGMETAYMAVSEFKESVTTNLDKMLEGNSKAVGSLDKQYDVLKKLKASEPGFLGSCYNTLILGQFGVLGVGEAMFQHSTRAIGWIGKNVYNLLSPGSYSYFEYSKTKKWHVGTAVNWLYQKYDQYVYQNAKKLDKNTDGVLGFFTSKLTFATGVLKAGVGLVNGVVTLVVDTETVVKSLDLILNDWGEMKRALKGLVHWDEWSESVAGAAGQTVGDLIIIFFTAGAGKGAAAAKAAAAMGKSSKLAYVAAFSKEIVRQTINTSIKVVKLPLTVLKVLASGGTGVLKKLGAIFSGIKNGEGLSRLRAVTQEILADKMAKVGVNATEMAKSLLSQKGLPVSSRVKSLLQKIKNSGVDTLTKAELGFLKKGLAKDLAGVSKWGTSNLVEKLGSTTGKYARLATKMEKITGRMVGGVGKLPGKTLSGAALEALKVNPKSVVGIMRTKGALEKYMRYLFQKKNAFIEELKILKDKIGPLKSKLKKARGKKAIKAIRKELDPLLAKQKTLQFKTRMVRKHFNIFKDKYSQLKYIDRVKAASTWIKTSVSDVYTKVAESVKNIKNIKPLEIGKVVGKKILVVAAWPLWLPTMYAKVLLWMNPARAKAILAGKGIRFGKGVDEVTGIVALGEISKKINGALLRGNLKEALYLYYGSRALGKQAGIPFFAMDKSFLGYLHRVAPITVKKIVDVKQLQDLTFIDTLPEEVTTSAAAMKGYEKKAADAIAKLIKSKPETKK